MTSVSTFIIIMVALLAGWVKMIATMGRVALKSKETFAKLPDSNPF